MLGRCFGSNESIFMMTWLRFGSTLRGRGGIRCERSWLARSLCVLAWWKGGLGSVSA